MTSLSIWQQLKEALVPTVTFWIVHLYTFVVFAACILAFDGINVENLIILGFMALVVFGGCLFGQVLAMLRVRTWTALVVGSAFWAVFFAMDMGLFGTGLATVGVYVLIALLLGPPAVWGGMWSLETNRALWSTWLPLIWMTGAILVWADKMGKDDAWFAADKYAVWDMVSLPVLGLTVALLLFYLVTRETHRLNLWKRGPEAPLPPSTPDKGASRPRISVLGVVLLLGLSLAVTAGTALVSPYLWRTGKGDGEGGGGGGGGEPKEQPQPREREGESPPPEEGDGRFGQRMKEMAEQAKEAGKQASSAACVSISILVLAALMWLVGWRPAKRLFLLRHLREPLWKVPPTTRIEQGWRLVQVALGDIGVFPVPGEDASGLARRAKPILEKLSPVEVHGLAEAAEAADRVRFGLGVTEEDLRIMERFSAWTQDTIWERLSDKEQLRAMYRSL